MTAAGLAADVVRLANGQPIDGSVLAVTTEGIQMQTPKGVQVFPWKYLSAGTRHRFEGKTASEAPAKK